MQAAPGPPRAQISVDRSRLLVRVILSGFFTPEASIEAGERVRAAIRTLGADVGKHRTLYDVSEMPISPATTVAETQAAFANPANRPLWARRLAFVTPSALARLQLQRLREVREDIAVFDTQREAMDWLMAE